MAAFGPAIEALFDLVSRTDLLPRVAPRGRVPGDFAARCLAIARDRRGRLDAEAAALEVAERLHAPRRAGRGDRARLRGPDDAGTRPTAAAHPRTSGAAGPAPVRDAPPLAPRDLARLARHARRYPGEPEEGLARGQLGIPGTTLLVDRRGGLHDRTVVPGSSIVVGPPLRSGRTSLQIAADRRGAERAARPFGRALSLLDAVWPEAADEVRVRTRLVLPLTEPGLVSFSLPSRPGVSFINLRGKSIVDLADDLLHETAHHRLHAIERLGPLVTKAALGVDAPRSWSPWRRAPRPVRGICHAAYTFAFRAELLSRLAADARPRGGSGGGLRPKSSPDAGFARRLEVEAARERQRVRESLADLRKAARRGLLTAAGRRLLRPIDDTVRERRPGTARA